MLRYHFTFFGMNHHVDRTKNYCVYVVSYLGEVDHFQFTRSTLANFKFQILAKVKSQNSKSKTIQLKHVCYQ